VFEEQVCTKTPGDAVVVTVINVKAAEADAERTVPQDWPCQPCVYFIFVSIMLVSLGCGRSGARGCGVTVRWSLIYACTGAACGGRVGLHASAGLRDFNSVRTRAPLLRSVRSRVQAFL
jgi:hypothetical protein